MLRLPQFDVVAPRTVAEAVAALARPGARLVAGGTDLLPNLKHRLDSPPVLVSLRRVAGLDEVERVAGAAEAATATDDPEHLRIGAGVTLSALSEHPLVREHLPSLARAAGLVASPNIRNMATIGGNVHLDTRCRYVNQSDFWRSAIGGCLKSEGDVCHVVPGGKNCVAAMSSDCVPVLITLDAAAVLVGPDGTREVALADYYGTDGVSHIAKRADELMTELRVPLPRGPRRAGYAKWTVRHSIDFPLVSVALRFDLDGPGPDAVIQTAKACVGVLNARPRLVKRTESLTGKRLDDPAVTETLCTLIAKQCKPLENVPYEAPYRHKMLPVYTRRAMQALLAEPTPG
ncbi:FAD binding domain-containing protein [Haliangium sp.]|uniref:FAD binding domain-containing protein n=1 Tax=Haliangium sp. TaxID=2663208 RepID=UPI003D0FD02E